MLTSRWRDSPARYLCWQWQGTSVSRTWIRCLRKAQTSNASLVTHSRFQFITACFLCWLYAAAWWMTEPLRSWQQLSGCCHICTCNSAVCAHLHSFGKPYKRGKAEASQAVEKHWFLCPRCVRSGTLSCIPWVTGIWECLKKSCLLLELVKASGEILGEWVWKAAPVTYEHKQEVQDAKPLFMWVVSCFAGVTLAIPSTHPLSSCCCSFSLRFTLLSRSSLCAGPGSIGYGGDSTMPSKAKAYSSQICLCRGWARQAPWHTPL